MSMAERLYQKEGGFFASKAGEKNLRPLTEGRRKDIGECFYLFPPCSRCNKKLAHLLKASGLVLMEESVREW